MVGISIKIYDFVSRSKMLGNVQRLLAKDPDILRLNPNGYGIREMHVILLIKNTFKRRDYCEGNR